MSQQSTDYRPVSELNFFRDNFFLVDGEQALVEPDDLLKTIRDHPNDELNPRTMEAVEHYWLHEPYSYAIIIYSHTESEYQYWCVEPHISYAERKQLSYLDEKIRVVAEDSKILQADQDELADIIQGILFDLVKRYDLADQDVLEQTSEVSAFQPHRNPDDEDNEPTGLREKAITQVSRWLESLSTQKHTDETDMEGVETEGGEFRETFSPNQVDKITYYLIRNIVGNDRINPLSHDFHVEDISCDGYNEPVFVHHTKHEELWTNIRFGEDELDDFVKNLAQSAGKGISKRDPVADVTLEDGSRANLTLGMEVSRKGSNFTIRQFKDVPFTPIDLINWETYSLEQMAYLWHAIEFGKNIIFAGGTASGKTTTLNAVSLFVPSKSKIVSIEDTPELELPQRNWVSSITRSEDSADSQNAFEEFDLLKNAFRQRPTYIIMGEVRGQEGRTLFQAMSSGHTTYTTFHANNATELVQRFTADQIGVDKPAFQQLDLVCNQEQVRVDGNKVRRSTEMKEVLNYDGDADTVQFRDMYEWDPQEDSFKAAETSKVLQDVRHKNGWQGEKFAREFQKRQVVLAYLVREGYKEYSEVAGTLQAFMNDPDTVMHYIATDQLRDFLDQLRSMKNVDIQVDPEVEDRVDRPKPNGEVLDEANQILDAAGALLNEYKNVDVGQAFQQTANPFDEDVDFGLEDPEPEAESDNEAEQKPDDHTTPESLPDVEQASEDAEDGQFDGLFEERPDEFVEAPQSEPESPPEADVVGDSRAESNGETAIPPESPPSTNGQDPDAETAGKTDTGTTSDPVDLPPAPPTPEEGGSRTSTESDQGNDTGASDSDPLVSPDLGKEDPDSSTAPTSANGNSRTELEKFIESNGLAPGDLPFRFDPNDCHWVIVEDGEYRQCGAPIGEDDKKCHIHSGKNQDLSELKRAVNSAVTDGGGDE